MKNATMAKSIVFSYFWVLAVGLGIFVLKLSLMKQLPVEEYALFDYAYGLITLFAFVGTLGLPYMTVRFVSQGYSPESIKSHFFSIIKFSVPLVALGFLGLWHLTLGGDYSTLLFALLCTIGLIVFNQYLAVFKGFKEYVTTGFRYRTLMVAAFLILSFVVLGVLKVRSAQAVLLLFSLILFLFILLTGLGHRRLSLAAHVKGIRRNRLLTYGLSMFALGVNGELIRNIDKIFVARLLDLKQLGIYSAALVFVIPFALLCHVIETVMYPYLKENVNLKKVMRSACIAAIGIGALYFLLIDEVIGFLVHSGLLNAGYLASVPAIKILSLGFSTLLIYAVSASTVIYSASRTQLWKIFGWTLFFGPVLGIVLNYLFVKRWGLLGAAYATDICLFLRALVWTVFAVPYFRLRSRAVALPPPTTEAVHGESERTMAKSSSGAL
ncbi:MAG: oligosaccharide flippase family protein [Candidatus Zixiibacteriota bacterium]|nr:MAG: oligosaccharide flippase family protein [candidate division Zixibacteria bacterium]